MGWSLRGILAGAGKGLADVADAHIANNFRVEAEDRAYRRQLSLADYQDALVAKREGRAQELKEKLEQRERESIAENMSLARAAAEEAGIKPNTKEFYEFTRNFMYESGRPKEAEAAEKSLQSIRDDARADKQLEGNLANAAATRFAAAESRRMQKEHNDAIIAGKERDWLDKHWDNLGTLTITSPDPNDPTKQNKMTDGSGVAILDNLYRGFVGNKVSKDDALRMTSELATHGQQLLRQGKAKTLGQGIVLAHQYALAEQQKPKE